VTKTKRQSSERKNNRNKAKEGKINAIEERKYPYNREEKRKPTATRKKV